MATLNSAYQGTSSINLWFKIQSGDPLSLSDVPAIIPLRWPFFRDNWDGLYPVLEQRIQSYSSPSLFESQLKAFTDFVNIQRTVQNPLFNPLSGSDVFYRFYTVFDNILITSIGLTNQEQKIVDTTVNTVSNYTKNNFIEIKSDLQAFRDRLSDSVGLTDPTYNEVFTRSAIAPQVSASIPDLLYMLQLNNTIKSVDFILANLFAVDAVVDPFTLARDNANNPEINIQNYSSGSLVRFNYGDSLEALAQRYLGDSNSWIDIAIANGLKPPYIDEIGVTVPLKTNGGGNTITLAQTDSNGQDNFSKLYVNQSLFIQSNTQLFPDQRTVINIVQIAVSGDIVVTLNGQDNLDAYTVTDQAYIRIYAPSTVNSNQFILIPSITQLPNDRQETVPWFLEKSPEDEKRTGIDLRIADTGDLLFTSNGDYALSYGLQNALQAVKLKLSTQIGELRFHQGFGIINVVGQNNQDTGSIRSAIVASLNDQISQDPRFDRIEALSVNYVTDNTSAPRFIVNMQVRLAGGSKVVPISFNMNYT